MVEEISYSTNDLPEEDVAGEEINTETLKERLGICNDMVVHLLKQEKSRELALVRTKIEEAILWLSEV